MRQALSPHPLSLLSLGDLGWIQIANFVVTGLLVTACAIGMRRVLHPARCTKDPGQVLVTERMGVCPNSAAGSARSSRPKRCRW